jgi:hypothetical protein
MYLDTHIYIHTHTLAPLFDKDTEATETIANSILAAPAVMRKS